MTTIIQTPSPATRRSKRSLNSAPKYVEQVEKVEEPEEKKFKPDSPQNLSLNPFFNPNSPHGERSVSCILCSFKITVDDTNVEARFHYANHMYTEGRFNDSIPEVSGVVKYCCPFSEKGCTKRKMSHREVCLHFTTQHQELRKVFLSDKRPKIKRLAVDLYPLDEPAKTTNEIRYPTD